MLVIAQKNMSSSRQAAWSRSFLGTKTENLQPQLVWGNLGLKLDTKWHIFHLGIMPKKILKPSEQIDQIQIKQSDLYKNDQMKSVCSFGHNLG